MLKIGVKVDGMDKLVAQLSGMKKQIRFASTKAVNSVAKKVVVANTDEIKRVFKDPRPVTQRAVIVKEYADYRKDTISATVAVDDGRRGSASESVFDANRNAQGKSAVPPSKFLLAQIAGGTRVAKRFERALQAAGVMPPDKVAIFAKRSGYLDQYGNLPGPKIVQILSWFKAFPEQGYRSNMTSKTRDAIAKGKRKGMSWGFAYFRGGRDTGLPDGIWERHYPNGQAAKSFVKPVLLYVSRAQYAVRFKFEEIASKTVQSQWSPAFNEAMTYAMRTAK